MDAPDHNSYEELVALAKDRKGWREQWLALGAQVPAPPDKTKNKNKNNKNKKKKKTRKRKTKRKINFPATASVTARTTPPRTKQPDKNHPFFSSTQAQQQQKKKKKQKPRQWTNEERQAFARRHWETHHGQSPTGPRPTTAAYFEEIAEPAATPASAIISHNETAAAHFEESTDPAATPASAITNHNETAAAYFEESTEPAATPASAINEDPVDALFDDTTTMDVTGLDADTDLTQIPGLWAKAASAPSGMALSATPALKPAISDLDPDPTTERTHSSLWAEPAPVPSDLSLQCASPPQTPTTTSITTTPTTRPPPPTKNTTPTMTRPQKTTTTISKREKQMKQLRLARRQRFKRRPPPPPPPDEQPQHTPPCSEPAPTSSTPSNQFITPTNILGHFNNDNDYNQNKSPFKPLALTLSPIFPDPHTPIPTMNETCECTHANNFISKLPHSITRFQQTYLLQHTFMQLC